MSHPANSRVFLVLGIGLIAISFASIFIKVCQAPAFVIAFYRLGISSLLYTALIQMRGRHSHLTIDSRQVRLALFSGAFLSLHFATWITSLKYTTVASSVVLVQTSPIFVALGSALFLREKSSWFSKFGIIIAFCGAVLIGAMDFSLQSGALFGDILAILGAIGAAGYLLIGRKLRAQLDTFHYVAIVYGTAAALTLMLVVFQGQSLVQYDGNTFFWLLLIALVPQTIGHTSLNWALKYFSATAVAIVTLGEPIGAAFLAWLLLDENVSALKIIGGTIILLGVLITLLAENRSRREKGMAGG